LEDAVVRKKHSAKQLKEQMKMLFALIEDGKISKQKQMELQEQYSWLQREYELMIKR